MPARPVGLSLTLVLGTVAAGLAIRFAHLGLPSFVTKYGGSLLWALTIYWLVSTLLPTSRLVSVALLSGVLATGVEFFKLYRSPGMDSFRHTLPGILLLGRVFSWWDIAAYWIGILLGVLADRSLRLRDCK